MPPLSTVPPYYGLQTPPTSPQNLRHGPASAEQTARNTQNALPAVMDLRPTYRHHLAAIAVHFERWRNEVCRAPQMVNDPLVDRLLATGALLLSRIERTPGARHAEDGPLMVAAAMRLAVMLNVDGFVMPRPSEWNDVYEAARLPERDAPPQDGPENDSDLSPAQRDALFYDTLDAGIQPYAYPDPTQPYRPRLTNEENSVLQRCRRYFTARTNEQAEANPTYAEPQDMVLHDMVAILRFNRETGYRDKARNRPGKPPAITQVERQLLACIGYNLHVTDAQVAAVGPVITRWVTQYRAHTQSNPPRNDDVDLFAGYVVKRLSPDCYTPCAQWPVAPLTPPQERPHALPHPGAARSASAHPPRRDGNQWMLSPRPSYPFTTIDPKWVMQPIRR